jgi:hypothetical protein
MSGVVDVMRRVVQQELARRRGSLLGVVTATFPHEADDDDNNYEVDVRLKHHDLELRKVPVAVGLVGVTAPPQAGDLVLVQFVDDDLNQPLVTARFYHADRRPPLHHDNEVLLEHRLQDATTTIRIDGDTGDLQIKAGDKVVIDVKHNGEVTLTCETLTVQGDVTIKGVLKVSTEDDTSSTTISGHNIEGA